MLFNSFEFLIFFPVVTTIYFLIPHRFRWMLILGASCYFYMAFIPVYILILCVTILVDYFAGIGLEILQGSQRRWLLLASIITNIGMLGFFKYFNFVDGNLATLANFLDWNYPIHALSIILPIGLSFHTFQSLSYTIEVYRRRQKAERHLGYLALYVMYYPQLVAGPIERPQNVLHQLHAEHPFEYQRVADGLKWMAWGLFKKVVIADRMALFVNSVYDAPSKHEGPALVFATVAFAIQIYCDFSGYSDIALGSSQVMGIKLMKNFDHPYFAQSIAEFWRRWHISLSTWFRDYLYIPLGGNRVTKVHWLFNLMVTFLVSGLWHGANWTYVIWGLLHGVYFIISSLTETLRERLAFFSGLNKMPRLGVVLSTLTTFTAVSFAWIFFRASSLTNALYIVQHMPVGWGHLWRHIQDVWEGGMREGLHGAGWNAIVNAVFEIITPVTTESRTTIVFTFLALGIWLTIEYLQYTRDFLDELARRPFYLRQLVYACLLTLILILGVGYMGTGQEFIYFQF